MLGHHSSSSGSLRQPRGEAGRCQPSAVTTGVRQTHQATVISMFRLDLAARGTTWVSFGLRCMCGGRALLTRDGVTADFAVRDRCQGERLDHFVNRGVVGDVVLVCENLRAGPSASSANFGRPTRARTRSGMPRDSGFSSRACNSDRAVAKVSRSAESSTHTIALTPRQYRSQIDRKRGCPARSADVREGQPEAGKPARGAIRRTPHLDGLQLTE